MLRSAFALLFTLVLLAPAWGQGKPKPPAKPTYFDDEKYYEKFVVKLTDLAKEGKCLEAKEVEKRVSVAKKAQVTPQAPKTDVLVPEDVYAAVLPSVFVVGSVRKDEDAETGYVEGVFATAWVLAEDGILVTNRHVFENLEGDCFGVADHKGKVYPVTDILGVDKEADMAIFKIGTKNLIPIPLATTPARVGAWVGVLSHPGNQLFTFTQGTVTRYCKNTADTGGIERWMNINADYAGGSSGGPVLDRFGNVVGMATVTSNIDYLEEAIIPDDKSKEKPKEKEKPKDVKDQLPTSTLQMVVKMTIPAASMLKMLEAK